MGKNSRWMTWVLEESASTDVTMPWARGTRPNWKTRLAEEAPGLTHILRDALSDSTNTFQRSIPARSAVQ